MSPHEVLLNAHLYLALSRRLEQQGFLSLAAKAREIAKSLVELSEGMALRDEKKGD